MEVQSCVNESGCNPIYCTLIKGYEIFACLVCISSLYQQNTVMSEYYGLK